MREGLLILSHISVRLYFEEIKRIYLNAKCCLVTHFHNTVRTISRCGGWKTLKAWKYLVSLFTMQKRKASFEVWDIPKVLVRSTHSFICSVGITQRYQSSWKAISKFYFKSWFVWCCWSVFVLLLSGYCFFLFFNFDLIQFHKRKPIFGLRLCSPIKIKTIEKCIVWHLN